MLVYKGGLWQHNSVAYPSRPSRYGVTVKSTHKYTFMKPGLSIQSVARPPVMRRKKWYQIWSGEFANLIRCFCGLGYLAGTELYQLLCVSMRQSRLYVISVSEQIQQIREARAQAEALRRDILRQIRKQAEISTNGPLPIFAETADPIAVNPPAEIQPPIESLVIDGATALQEIPVAEPQAVADAQPVPEHQDLIPLVADLPVTDVAEAVRPTELDPSDTIPLALDSPRIEIAEHPAEVCADDAQADQEPLDIIPLVVETSASTVSEELPQSAHVPTDIQIVQPESIAMPAQSAIICIASDVAEFFEAETPQPASPPIQEPAVVPPAQEPAGPHISDHLQKFADASAQATARLHHKLQLAREQVSSTLADRAHKLRDAGAHAGETFQRALEHTQQKAQISVSSNLCKLRNAGAQAETGLREALHSGQRHVRDSVVHNLNHLHDAGAQAGTTMRHVLKRALQSIRACVLMALHKIGDVGASAAGGARARVPQAHRALIKAAYGFSLLVFFCLAALWLRSWDYSDRLHVSSFSGRVWMCAGSVDGRIYLDMYFYKDRREQSTPWALEVDRIGSRAYTMARFRTLDSGSLLARHGWRFVETARHANGTSCIACIPFWVMVIPAGALFAWHGTVSWRRHRRSRRMARGLCIKCGYDLRASAAFCPGCGSLIPATFSVAPAAGADTGSQVRIVSKDLRANPRTQQVSLQTTR